MLAAFLADLDVIVKSEDVVVFLALEIVVSDKLLVFGCASSVEFNFGLILPCSSISCKSVKTPKGDFSDHIEKKMQVGHLWVERLRWNKCPAGDGWLGFRYSLIPKVTYGFAAITIDPDVLERSFQKLYRDVLSPLRVNENITKFYRMAPKRVMGLGMPNPGIKMLAYKLHLLQTEWNQPTLAGQMLRQSLEVFQMESGLSTNIKEAD